MRAAPRPPPGLEPGPALPLRPAPRPPASEPRGPALCVTLLVSVQPAGPQRRWGRNGRAMARPGLQGQRWGEGWVLLCDGWWCRADSPGSLFPLLPTLPHNRLTVSGTHSSGDSAPPLAKNRRPRKLLSHPHGVRNGEETFPMPEWVVSGSSLWGWSSSLAPNQAAGLRCQLPGLVILGWATGLLLKHQKSWGREGGEQKGHIQVRAVSQAGGLGG